MKGFVVVNAYSKAEEYLYQAKRLKKEFNKRNIEFDILSNDNFLLNIKDNTFISKVSDYDFCVYWDKDKYILSMLEKIKMPLFNPVDAIISCDDKVMTYIELANHDLPLIDTLPGLLCYSKDEKIKEETIKEVEKLGYPLVLKESYGSLGSGVYLIKNQEELRIMMEKVKCIPHLFQKYISTSYGRDCRIIIIGHQYVGAMLRKSDKDFRSNIGAGGGATIFEPTKEMIDIAIKASEVLNLDYCGIDLLFGEKGPLICEVNSNAFFYTFERTTKINVAGKYADYIIKKMSK